MIWSKAFVAERERYDGADVAHLIRACHAQMNWDRLLARFGPHWRLLLSHLVLFDFIYPSERAPRARGMTRALARRLAEDGNGPHVEQARVCQGTLLSRAQYLPDVTAWGYADGRVPPRGRMSKRTWSTGPRPSTTRSKMSPMRIAAVGDLHCKTTSQGAFEPLFAAMSRAADVVVLAGDLTDYGLPDEAQVLARELRAATAPVIAVLGNHDYESDAADQVRAILEGSGVKILDGGTHEVGGVGFAGAKGLGGGFGERALQPWGEEVIEATRPRVAGGGVEARVRAGAPAHVRAGSGAPLLADPRHGRGRAPGDLPVSRLQPTGGAARSLLGDAGRPRPRSPRPRRGAHSLGGPRLQRMPSAPAGPVPDEPPFRLIDLGDVTA